MSQALAAHFSHDDLLPRPHGGMGRGAVLALLAHGALVLALTSTVQWRTRPPEVFSAELWAAVPQVAAPLPTEAPPPIPAISPAPLPAPAPKPAPPPAAPERDADIATEQARKLEALRKQQEAAAAAAAAAADAAKAAKAAEAEKAKAERAKAEADIKAKREAEAKKADERKRLEAERKAAADSKAKADALAKAKAEDDRLAKQREENLRRMMGQAGTTGTANSGTTAATGPTGTGGTGTAAEGGAPSASYVGRLIALIKPNIVFTGQVVGNPSAEVEVRAAAGGSIMSRSLVKSSGDKDWDEAVLRAIDRTPSLPRDNDGRVPPKLILVFRPGG